MKSKSDRKIEDNVEIPLNGGFSQGGCIRGCDSTIDRLVHHSDSFFFMDKETLRNGISKLEEMNNNAKITKTEDSK